MKNRIISIIFMVVSMVIMVIVLHVYPNPVREPVEDNLYYEYNIVERVLPNDYNHAKSAAARLDAANRLTDVLAELGYTGDHPAAALAEAEVINAIENVNYYTYYVEELKWAMYSN